MASHSMPSAEVGLLTMHFQKSKILIIQCYNNNNNFIYSLESEVNLHSVVFTITGIDGIQ